MGSDDGGTAVAEGRRKLTGRVEGSRKLGMGVDPGRSREVGRRRG